MSDTFLADIEHPVWGGFLAEYCALRDYLETVPEFQRFEVEKKNTEINIVPCVKWNRSMTPINTLWGPNWEGLILVLDRAELQETSQMILVLN